jgi:competence protein ComEA
VKGLLDRRVPLVWLIGAFALAPALAIIYKLWVLDAPPSGVLIVPAIETPTVLAQPVARGGRATPPTAEPTQTPILCNPSPTPSPDTPTKAATEPAVTATPTTQATPTVAGVIAYISGEVARSGVYHLPVDSRIADLVQAAGGLTPNADANLINLAERITDEEHVIVPAKGVSTVAALVETPVRTATRPAALPTKAPDASTATAGVVHVTATKAPTAPLGKVNINSASQQELETLPGIGPSLASKIIAYRQANGPFAAPEDLMKVSGIKEGVYSKLRDYITVAP